MRLETNFPGDYIQSAVRALEAATAESGVSIIAPEMKTDMTNRICDLARFYCRLIAVSKVNKSRVKNTIGEIYKTSRALSFLLSEETDEITRSIIFQEFQYPFYERLCGVMPSGEHRSEFDYIRNQKWNKLEEAKKNLLDREQKTYFPNLGGYLHEETSKIAFVVRQEALWLKALYVRCEEVLNIFDKVVTQNGGQNHFLEHDPICELAIGCVLAMREYENIPIWERSEKRYLSNLRNIVVAVHKICTAGKYPAAKTLKRAEVVSLEFAKSLFCNES